MKGITLFIPLYNEAEILKKNTLKLRNYCKTLGIPFQIILGSNGSTDKTRQIGEALAATYPEIIFFHVQKKGPGLALKTALPYVKYPFVLTLDMDLSISLKFIPQALMLLEQGKRFVIGAKQTGNQQRQWWRIFLSNGFIFLTRFFLGLPFHDYSLAAKVWPTSFLKRQKALIDDGTAYVFTLLYLAKEANQPMKEIPVSCHDTRKSKFNLFHEVPYRFLLLVKTIFLKGKRNQKRKI